ncbi:smoothelin [Denticeps clupeoides]|uniref:smoothelin n=1 Tax=Denticeps clupeoides TaxID=299321 RepID=UPI0010A35EBF|nr:smoothelin-like protein 1 [Denticeps clupeoides]
MEGQTKSVASQGGKLTSEQLAAIDDEQVLNDMLDKAVDFDERRMLRAALRELLNKKREQRERERGSRQQDLRQKGVCSGSHPVGDGTNKALGQTNGRGATQKTAAQSKASLPPASSHSNPSTSTTKAPVCMGEAAVPNSKNVKQMLLDWCRAKTEPYEGVNIQNFSSSWADGLAFCALVHRFFPEGFDYCTLDPYDRRANFEKAFKTAEKLADCACLLDVDDLVRMPEPDWKCVYTYIQEFYRCLVQKGLVKTKKRTL